MAMTIQANQVNFEATCGRTQNNRKLLETNILRFNGGSPRCKKQKPLSRSTTVPKGKLAHQICIRLEILPPEPKDKTA
jgi:hypothetical protein